jgi:hypothetical protein
VRSPSDRRCYTPRVKLRRCSHRVLAVAILLLGGHAAAISAIAAAPERPSEWWDVIVVGAEPEAIAAAVAAAEEGARTLLLAEDPRLGGLFVRGALNVLDLRVTPVDYQRGLFERWWRMVGRFGAFDLERAERAFADLLAAAGVTVRLSQPTPRPWRVGERVVGVLVGGDGLRAAQVVDGTADADLADAAGAASTWGFASIGLDARMADTLVFRIDGVDWDALRRGAAGRGRGYAYVDERVAYGHFGGHPAAYRAVDPDLRLRGLNLGRQDDGSVLVNALLIYGVDALDPASRDAGRARAAAEIDRIVAWLARDLPGFERARAGGVADALYVRQTRHLDAECRLTIDDVLDHVVTDQDVAAGGYPLDVQTLRPSDDGFVFGLPEVYGGRLCMLLPRGVDGLWVVGRSAGYDPMAHASARVVPFGMAMAEAAGVAAAYGSARGLSPRVVATGPGAVAAVRTRLAARGAHLPDVRSRPPAGPAEHAHYEAFRAMLRWGLAVGGYANDPALDAEAAPASLLHLLANLGQRAMGAPDAGSRVIARLGRPDGPLEAAQAAEIVAAFLLAAGVPNALPVGEAGTAWSDLVAAGFDLADPGRPLRRGEVYAIGAWLLELHAEATTLRAQGPETDAER